MAQCKSCGAFSSPESLLCSQCGGEVVAGRPSHQNPPVLTATIAIPPSSHSAPSASIGDEEGRFIAGTLVAGRYRIIGLLGRGGMGEVYRATDLTLSQPVALKFLPRDAALDERLLERFHSEVRIARLVTHPNVCRVYDVGEADGYPFISMEFIDGEDLASLLQRIGRVPSNKALEITHKLCAGVAAAHDRGVIHRDLKPHNVMLNKRGDIVIMDFGLAAITQELTGSEVRSGTPAYMAPEQLRGDSVTPKSDLYSLGLIAYELFTGRRAFEGASVLDLLHAEEFHAPASMTDAAPEIDPAVERAVLQCLQPDPKFRPSSARLMAAALPGGDPLAAALAAGETPSPELVAASGRARGMTLRYALLCLGIIVIGVLVFPFLWQPLSLYALAPMEYSSGVLEQKARDMSSAFGAAGKPLDWASRFQNNDRLLDYLSKHRGSASWQQVFSAASPVEFWYRQSPNYFSSPPDGAILPNRPPRDEPGMVSVLLDSRGRLRQFEAVVPRYESLVPRKEIDPAEVFRAAGLDFGNFHEATPTYAPALAFDARRAWTGSYSTNPDIQVTVELATSRGAVTSFFISWPWTSRDTLEKT